MFFVAMMLLLHLIVKEKGKRYTGARKFFAIDSYVKRLKCLSTSKPGSYWAIFRTKQEEYFFRDLLSWKVFFGGTAIQQKSEERVLRYRILVPSTVHTPKQQLCLLVSL